MKREILDIKRASCITSCCPGHDTWPNETYKGRASKKRRNEDMKKEHRYVRHVKKQELTDQVEY